MSASMLSESHAVNLLSVDFLCRLCQQTDKSLHTECVLADLVKLVDCDNGETWSCPKTFDIHLVSESRCVVVYCNNSYVDFLLITQYYVIALAPHQRHIIFFYDM